MGNDLIAKASISIDAPRQKVWEALVNPEAIHQFMFGTHVVSDFREGSPIIWKGEWQGRPYEDKGTILKLQPWLLLQYSHFSPLSGLPDLPENYHTVTIRLSMVGDQTVVSLAQDHNANEEERMHSEENWKMMLMSLKKYVEQAELK
jgi:uncharacterized protein YndB with AHSA1/START domain